MPAYARDGKVVCFFQAASKFKTRYATLGFNDSAHLDDGTMWPTAFALTTLTADDEKDRRPRQEGGELENTAYYPLRAAPTPSPEPRASREKVHRAGGAFVHPTH